MIALALAALVSQITITETTAGAKPGPRPGYECAVRPGVISDCDMRQWDLAQKYNAVWTATDNGRRTLHVRWSVLPYDWALIRRTATQGTRDRPY